MKALLAQAKAVVFMLNPKKLCNTIMAKFHCCLTLGPIQLLISSSMVQHNPLQPVRLLQLGWSNYIKKQIAI